MVENKDIEFNEGLDDEKNLDESNEGLDFSDELSNLENNIREIAWDKIKQKEQEEKEQIEKEQIVSKTKGNLESLHESMLSWAESWLEQKQVNETWKDKVSEFFDVGKEEFEKIDTKIEKRVVKKHGQMVDKFAGRPEAVKESIQSSADKILDEIYNWKEEKNPVARSLLRIVNWIMKTEK